MVRVRFCASRVAFPARTVLEEDAHQPTRNMGGGDDPRPVAAQCVTNARVKGLEAHVGVRLAGEHEQRSYVLLRIPGGPFGWAFGDKDDGSQALRFDIFSRTHGRGQEIREWIVGFSADVRGNTLRGDPYPFAFRIVVPML